MRLMMFFLAAALAGLVAAPAYPQAVLVWDKDHNGLFADPEGAGSVDASYGITKALDDNGYSYTKVTTLPTDLGPYDVIFVVMGTYC